MGHFLNWQLDQGGGRKNAQLKADLTLGPSGEKLQEKIKGKEKKKKDLINS